MKKNKLLYIIGIDGGASKTRGVIFTHLGQTLATSIINQSANLKINGDLASDCIINIIRDLCEKAKVDIENIDALGLGLAGSSSKDGREILFGKLDNLKLSSKALIINDAEAAYELSCPGDVGILVTVGTGVICIARKGSKIIRQAGKGHFEGDIGSGYWIGKQAILNLTLNETTVMGDPNLEQIMSEFFNIAGGENFQNSLEELYEKNNAVTLIASLAKEIINLAENENEIAISIIQEATHAVANYIINITDELNFNSHTLLLAGNGSVISNDYYRSLINDELSFHFPNVNWIFSKLSPAYGAAIMSARIRKVHIDIGDILKGEFFVPA
tara:strand:- start:200 stop:1189 length:990 start_codon:yes stop_codon:yes gene_type:complete